MSKNLAVNNTKRNISIDNWRIKPFNSWESHNVKKLISSLSIENNLHSSTILRNASKSLNGLLIKILFKITSADSIVVFHNDEIAYLKKKIIFEL